MENRRSEDNFDSGQTSRVEVYRLSEDGKWEDHGTGHVTLGYLERSEDLGLFVIDEEDNETLLVHRITVDDIYRKQEDTIISWKDPQYSTELALSFQETSGCSYLWDQICKVQRSLYFGSRSRDIYRSVNSELRELPAVEFSTIPLILKIVVESGVTDQMHLTELILHDKDFFRKLMDLFRICEDLENVDNLYMICKIVKGIIMLNSPQIFEKVFGDELIMDIIGCLEYDPEVSHVRHRDFLKEHVIFKEAIPIKDPTVLSKIHQTYRISYLKDVVLPRVLDDATVASLNSMVHANNGVVVSLLKEDNTFIQELFSRLRSSSISRESKKNLVQFLHEFCTLSKSLQVVQQLRLFRDLVVLGLFDIISDILQNEDKRLVLTGTDILLLSLNQDPNLLRSYVVRPEGTPLLGLLVQGMLTDFGDDMHCQFLEILRTLLDSYTSSGSQRDTIIEIFYEKHMEELIDVITSSCSGGGILAKSAGETSVKHGNTKPDILLNICEMLSFCVVHHPHRTKCYFLQNNSMDKVLYLTRRREKYLVAAAVRFLRTVVSRNDDTLNDYIVKRNLLKPIVDAFVSNGDRYNLLNSAVLELFEYILKEKLKSLVNYLMKTFWNQLVKFDYLASIKSLQVRYEQSLEIIETEPAVNLDSRKRVEERALEKEEEDYFNEDSDEEDTASAMMPRTRMGQDESIPSNGSVSSSPLVSSRPGGLVDYEDDEEEEQYKPPPRRPTDASDEDEITLESLTAKRKMASNKEGHGIAQKPRLNRSSKSTDSVFASLCSTLSQAVLPNKKAASIIHNASHPSNTKMDTNNEEKETEVSGSQLAEANTPEEENGSDRNVASRGCLDTLVKAHDNGRLESKDHPHIPSNSSPEMTVNGS